MAYTREYLEKNRDAINDKRRAKYCTEKRKAKYQQTRETLLQKAKGDRACCPLCNLEFRRLYIKNHIATRHKVQPPEDLNELICKSTSNL